MLLVSYSLRLTIFVFPFSDEITRRDLFPFCLFLKKAVDLFVTMCYNSITISLEVSPWLKKMKF